MEWDDDRGLNRDGMNLPTQCIYIGCIDMEVTDEAEARGSSPGRRDRPASLNDGPPRPSQQESIERLLLENYSCVVLFLDPELKAAYYHGFCRGYLTPILHNQMHQHRGVDPFQEGEWRAYCTVNRLFAAKVMEVYSPGHMIWVHDYHLMLLPSCILRKLRSAKIGSPHAPHARTPRPSRPTPPAQTLPPLAPKPCPRPLPSPPARRMPDRRTPPPQGLFIHAPFPASDLWGSVAVRTELLRSLLNADLLGLLLLDPLRSSSHPLLTSRGRSVGFLLFEYTRNFLSCCKRMLGLEYEFHKGGYLGVEYEGRHVMLQVATFGISPPKLEAPLAVTSHAPPPAHLLIPPLTLHARRG